MDNLILGLTPELIKELAPIADASADYIYWQILQSKLKFFGAIAASITGLIVVVSMGIYEIRKN